MHCNRQEINVFGTKCVYKFLNIKKLDSVARLFLVFISHCHTCTFKPQININYPTKEITSDYLNYPNSTTLKIKNAYKLRCHSIATCIQTLAQALESASGLRWIQIYTAWALVCEATCKNQTSHSIFRKTTSSNLKVEMQEFKVM